MAGCRQAEPVAGACRRLQAQRLGLESGEAAVQLGRIGGCEGEEQCVGRTPERCLKTGSVATHGQAFARAHLD